MAWNRSSDSTKPGGAPGWQGDNRSNTSGSAKIPNAAGSSDVSVGRTLHRRQRRRNVMFWAVIAFGLPALGKVPTAWLGKPFAVSERAGPLHVHAQVDVMATPPQVPAYVPLVGHNTRAVVTEPDTAVGVTVTAPEAALAPAEFVAVTVQLYAVPFVSVVTLIGLAVAVPVRVAPPPVHDAV